MFFVITTALRERLKNKPMGYFIVSAFTEVHIPSLI